MDRDSRVDRSSLRVTTRRSFLRGGVALAAAGSLTSLLAACGDRTGGGGGQALKIGLLAPVTGPVAQEGNALARGFELGVESINADGGVLGEKVTAISENDQGDPAKAVTAARKLIQRDEVNLLFGTITTDTTNAVAKLAGQFKVPFLQVIIGTNVVCDPYFFKLGESSHQVQSVLLPYMRGKYGPKVALVGNDYAFPRKWNEVARRELKPLDADVVSEEYAPLGTSDWAPVIGKLERSKPDWVLASVVGGDAVAFMKQADSLGLLDAAQITGIPLMQDFHPAIGDLVTGRQWALRYTDQLDNARNRAFVDAYRKKHRDRNPISTVTASAYVGLQLVAAAAAEADSVESDKLAAALRGLRAETLYGPQAVGFDAASQTLAAPVRVVEIRAGGKYAPIKDGGVVEERPECE